MEPDPTLPKYRYRISQKLGAGVKDKYSHIFVGDDKQAYEILAFEKDSYRNWLFQFGNLLFPNACVQDGFLCTGQSLKKIDGKTIWIKNND